MHTETQNADSSLPTPSAKMPAGRDATTNLYRLAVLANKLGAGSSAEEAESLAARVSEGRFYVACVGQFKRGKSTLLGALIGEQLLPTGFVPITSVLTVLRYGSAKSARVRLQKGDWLEIPLEDVKLYVSEEYNSENTKGVEGVEIFVPSDLLRNGMCLVDTPGLGSIFSGNSVATQSFIPHIDAALVVVGADPPIAGEELTLVESVDKQVRDLLVVINKSDRTSDEERAAVVSFTNRILRERLHRSVGEIYQVSAIEVLQKNAPTRDWSKFEQALQQLANASGSDLVRVAGERGVHRIGETLLAVVSEEREALIRPIQETERRIEDAKRAVVSSERSLQDLSYLLTAEQHRLSDLFLSQRRAFVEQTLPAMRRFLDQELAGVRTRYGPAFRREAMAKAQEIVKTNVIPWLRDEQTHAEREYKRAVSRFVEAANEYLKRMAESGLPLLARMPNALDIDANFRGRPHFYFNDLIYVANPASPMRWLVDLLLGLFGGRSIIESDVQAFLEHLLQVNGSRVQSDIIDRVQESRSHLEAQLRRLLLEVNRIAERALENARSTLAAGSSAVTAQLATLAEVEREVRSLTEAKAHGNQE